MSFATSPVIPVLDLMIGQVVLAQGGDRGNYLPVHSKLTNSSNPVDVAQALFNQTGSDCLYLADIDSFSGARPNWNTYNQILDRGFGMMVDADWMTNDRWQQIKTEINQPENLKIILSSETMSSPEQFKVFGELVSQGVEPVFSLDQKGGQVITQPGKLEEAEPIELAEMAYSQGVRNLIILDLDSVGTMNGCCPDGEVPCLIKTIHEAFPDLRIISGGGIRGVSDVQALLDSGCNHVLVASAIHECRLTPFDVAGLVPSSDWES